MYKGKDAGVPHNGKCQRPVHNGRAVNAQAEAGSPTKKQQSNLILLPKHWATSAYQTCAKQLQSNNRVSGATFPDKYAQGFGRRRCRYWDYLEEKRKTVLLKTSGWWKPVTNGGARTVGELEKLKKSKQTGKWKEAISISFSFLGINNL